MKRLLIAAAVLIVPLGCSDAEPDSPGPSSSTCGADKQVGDVCAGVPSGALCSGSSCAPSSCTLVTLVTDDLGLSQAIDEAPEDGCIVLSPGNYASITIPAKRLGIYAESPDTTEVASVTVSGSERATLDGFTTSTVQIDAGNAELNEMRIADAIQDGLYLALGTSATLERSEILRAGRYGVNAFDATITISTSIVEDTAGPGMWVQCASGCDCASALSSTISDSTVRGSGIVGISAVGVAMTLDNVEVIDITVGQNFQAGGGVSIAHCSTVTATNLTVADSSDFGLLVHDSSLDLNGATIAGNLRGMWVQNVGQSGAASVTVDNAYVSDNQGVGIGIDGGSINVAVLNSTIDGTQAIALPVLVGGVSAGAEEVGDGITWKAFSQVQLDSVTVTGSARASVLIDGEVGSGSSIANVSLAGGDETKGILQQNLPAGGVTPVTSGSSPTVTELDTEQYAVPTDVAVPPGI